MDPTLLFLKDRKRPGRDHRASRDWAIRLLEEGHESDAILRLAGITEATWHLEPELVAQVLCDIALPHLLNQEAFLAEFEKHIVAEYYAGKIDGAQLIELGHEVFGASHDCSQYVFWTCLADDASLHDGDGYCVKHRFDVAPFNKALKQALADHGYPAPLNRDDRNSH